MRDRCIQGEDDLQDPSRVTRFPVGLGAGWVRVVTIDATGSHQISGRKAQSPAALKFLKAVKRFLRILPQIVPRFVAKLILQAAILLAPGKRIGTVQPDLCSGRMFADSLA